MSDSPKLIPFTNWESDLLLRRCVCGCFKHVLDALKIDVDDSKHGRKKYKKTSEALSEHRIEISRQNLKKNKVSLEAAC